MKCRQHCTIPSSPQLLGRLLLWLPILKLSSSCSSDELPQFYESSYATRDFAQVGMSKEMSLCRVKSAFVGCSIQWYKDGEPIKGSTKRVFFLDEGQRLTISEVEDSDGGLYSCTVSNKQGAISRNLTMETYDHPIEKPFNKMFTSCELANTSLGGNVSAACMFDVQTYARDTVCTWFKHNASVPEGSDEEWIPVWAVEGLLSDDTFCEENSSWPLCGENPPGEILFTCLNLYNLKEEDYGKYKVVVSHDYTTEHILTLYEREETVIKTYKMGVIFGVAASTVFILLLTILLWQLVKTDVKLLVKDTMGRTKENDGKIYDAYISHAVTDFDIKFVICLKKHLEERGYKVFVPEIHLLPGGCTAEQIKEALGKSRRFIMVLSPEYIDATYSAFEASSFLEEADSYKKKIISILFRDMEVKQEKVQTILKHMVKFSNVVEWRGCTREETSPSGQVGFGSNNPEVDRQDSRAQLQVSEQLQESERNKQVERTFKSKVFKELLLGMPPKPRKGSSSSSNGVPKNLTMDKIENGNSSHCV